MRCCGVTAHRESRTVAAPTTTANCICCLSHAVLAAVASTGPTPDGDQLQGVMDRLPQQLKLETMVADAGFDSAFIHRLLRETHGIRSTIPPEHGRPPKNLAALPTDKYRRLMKRRFNTRAYRFRAQVETPLKHSLVSSESGRGER
jgi:Transposase DDE domain